MTVTGGVDDEGPEPADDPSFPGGDGGVPGELGFVVVTGFGESGSVKLFDPRLDRGTELTRDQFNEQWSGLALVFATPRM